MITWNRFFFQSPSSIIIEVVVLMHDYVIIFLFTIFLTIFLKFLNLMFLKNWNMEFFENHQIETIWTILPFLILVIIAVPSINSLYILDSCSFCGLTVIITGHQWYWTYFIKNINSREFNSYIIENRNIIIRLIDVDNRLIIPSNLPVRFLSTSADVIHSWTVPRIGFKIDAIPGRVNQFCSTTKKSGIYFGQCSEICGRNHRFIPIVVESLNPNFLI